MTSSDKLKAALAENARLRALVRGAYFEGRSDQCVDGDLAYYIDVAETGWRESDTRAALSRPRTPPLNTGEAETSAGVEELLQKAAARFCAWSLPDDFHPDAGISFKPTFNDTPAAMAALGLSEPMRHRPTGTNLLSVAQAKDMLRHVLAPFLAALTSTRPNTGEGVERWRDALLEIAGQDDTEMALDPQWAKRVARVALQQEPK